VQRSRPYRSTDDSVIPHAEPAPAMPSKLQEVGPLWATVPRIVRTPEAEISAAEKFWSRDSSRPSSHDPWAIAPIIRYVLARSTRSRGPAHQTHVEKPCERFRE
jgi:hypothetical protein